MKWVLDTHTHTYVSGHAYSTLMENIQYAKKQGLEILGVTDHGPKMPGGPNIFYFGNLKVIPREVEGITILKGCEANIIDFNGNLDIPLIIQENRLDIIIASLHDVCITPGTLEENTNALLGAMDNKFVDIIGHPGNPSFPIDEELVVRKAKEMDKIIEINNSSFRSRPGCEENCLNIARLCKKYNVRVIMGSDSHFCTEIGVLDKAYSLLQKVDMPDELIMNTHKYKIIEYLKGKGKLKDI
ncbi:phosphatase [Clostridium hydrogeniformans]|uniref:phosphatase n=1 Tax=Clostridium hydrogeniformans TaxID=349933 RepID=UPI000484D658|nr:phosphatase [Clostridium hydrogeniformans]